MAKTKADQLSTIMERGMKNGFMPKYPVAIWFDDKFNYQGNLSYKNYYLLLFDHDFAKAYWGEGDTNFSECPFCEYPGLYDVPVWQYHLQQAVISEDLIDYYFRNYTN